MSRTAEKDKKADAVDGEEATPGGRKKLLVMVLVPVLAIAAGLWFFVFSGSSAEAQTPKEGTVLTLDPVAVNLAGGGYLKVGIALQFTEDASAGGEGSSLDGSKALDLVIAEFSQAQAADVAASRDALKADLEHKISQAYHGGVMAIYYTSYVTQ